MPDRTAKAIIKERAMTRFHRLAGAALFVFTKVRSRNDDDLWQQATNS